jgi:protein phosphatase
VGDSRAYRLRDGELLRLTDDHSLVDELLRQGRLTPEEAVEHPQRSVITRALGPEGAVDVDTRSYSARGGDVYLLCSDGLTTMVPEDRLASLLLANPLLRDAGEALIAAANEAGGRDNITVVLVRLEDLDADGSPPVDGSAAAGAPTEQATDPALPPAAVAGPDTMTSVAAPPAATFAAPVIPRRPRRPAPDNRGSSRRRLGLRRVGGLVAVLAVLAVLGSGIYLALQSVYFIGTNSRGLVTVFSGVPFRLPGSIALYSTDYVSGVSASTLTPQRRRTLLDHSLRSEANAAALIRSLELGQLE